ncbi:S9 family peptidase [Mesobacillus stamsii]|uniref:Dipeptidyl aminopeptidase/acylaminoacyl peptidase n=1 Tax=Mesobacillus stamsii TaxID=225347 RepID=A0ABU0FYZ3_9BACI|nr:S9 family peptidase [Mesobacillus stamsii]MDQ0415124.1 dipeptidyl aminopeptidase/acylaminoacyl peptidase [Mesobacillus stamsii]
MEKRLIKPEDLFELKSVTDPQYSPDGKKCVFVLTEMLEGKNDYASNLYIIDIENSGEPKQWTYGENRNQSPRWSPDGTELAFVSNRNGKNQIFVLDAAGGEAKQVTDFKNGASDPVWSPDGKKIACSVSLKPDEDLFEKAEEKKDDKKLEPFVAIEMKYKSDAAGFWDGKYKQIVIVSVIDGEAELVAKGEMDSHLQCWAPDGKSLVLSADESPERDFSFKSDLWILDIQSGVKTKITNGKGYFGDAVFSPDGKHIGYTGHEREFENATLSQLYILSLETGHVQCLTENMDILVGDAVAADFQQGAHSPGLIWGEDSESLYFLATDQGSTVLYFATLNGEVYPALLNQQHVYGYTLDRKNQRMIAAISNPVLPGELFQLEATTGEIKQLTSVNEKFLASITLAQPEQISFEASDGTPLHGWIMKPARYEVSKKYPLILEVHGGPHAMYANSYFNEFQVLAAAGYGVLYINPRGSHGYGQQFVNAVRGDYGGGDYQDVMDAVDYALQNYDFIDKNRLGVTGGSYGGFMTNWIVGHTDKFKAAVTQRSISNWISFYGVSDIGYYFTEWQIKADLSDLETLWKHSPLAYVDQITTPLLILHSEKDYRCPIEQAEQLFIALKRQGKETKFIRFPESNHELSRSGKPNLRLSRLAAIVDWFDLHL